MVWTKIRPTSKRLMFFRQSKLYKQSKKEFYEGRNLLTSSSSFSQLFVNHKLESQPSQKNIKFYGLAFGAKTKECRKRLGKPNFIDSRSLVIKGLKTFFYRIQIKGVKCILQVHFYQDQFFFGQMEIREGNLEIKKQISQLLCQKYEIESEHWQGAIVDHEGNQLLIKEDIIPSISYLTSNQQILGNIKQTLLNKVKEKNLSFNQKFEWLLDIV